MSEEENLANKNMGELLDLLANNEIEQYKIYNVYRRAAEVDLTMRELKNDEERIRRYMALKIGV